MIDLQLSHKVIKKINGRAFWVCRCICGNEVEVASGALVSGNTRSCGSIHRKNLVGKSYGRLLVIASSNERTTSGSIKYNCICKCGKNIEVSAANLVNNNTKSCGCLQKDMVSKSNTTHGLTNISEYGIWGNILYRCINSNSRDYSNYGGRGIRVCDRWINSFENFLADMSYRPSPDHSIDRIDNDGNYEPGNCRWATAKEQANNKSNNVRYNYKGKDYTEAQIAKEFNINRMTFRQRVARGWSIEEAIEKAI